MKSGKDYKEIEDKTGMPCRDKKAIHCEEKGVYNVLKEMYKRVTKDIVMCIKVIYYRCIARII